MDYNSDRQILTFEIKARTIMVSLLPSVPVRPRLACSVQHSKKRLHVITVRQSLETTQHPVSLELRGLIF